MYFPTKHFILFSIIACQRTYDVQFKTMGLVYLFDIYFYTRSKKMLNKFQKDETTQEKLIFFAMF